MWPLTTIVLRLNSTRFPNFVLSKPQATIEQFRIFFNHNTMVFAFNTCLPKYWSQKNAKKNTKILKQNVWQLPPVYPLLYIIIYSIFAFGLFSWAFFHRLFFPRPFFLRFQINGSWYFHVFESNKSFLWVLWMSTIVRKCERFEVVLGPLRTGSTGTHSLTAKSEIQWEFWTLPKAIKIWKKSTIKRFYEHCFCITIIPKHHWQIIIE